MKISFARPLPRALFLAAIAAIAIAIVYAAGRIGAAAILGSSSNPVRWQLAARLEPENSDYWRRLGVFEQWDLEHGNLQQAIQDFHRATQADPGLDLNWLDLASAYETLGQFDQARQAYQMAQVSHPSSSDVAWRYGGFLLRQNDPADALREMRRALESDPRLAANAVSECQKAGISTEQILDQLLPPGRKYYLAALGYLVDEQDADAAQMAWNHLTGLKESLDLRELLPFVNLMIRADRPDAARHAWQQALAMSGWPQDPADGSSLIFNGGFEHDPANGGFDWRIVPMNGPVYGFDTEVYHSGKRSFEVSFDGRANYDFHHLVQFVAVEPGKSYRFRAYLRTRDISTDSGMRFEITDFQHPKELDLSTDNLIGTNPWTLAQADFTTPADTHWLVITLRRYPTWKFDNKFRGSVWADDVSLVPLANPSAKEQGR
jgi:tetratricopeptide (TPR) repeat protein